VIRVRIRITNKERKKGKLFDYYDGIIIMYSGSVGMEKKTSSALAGRWGRGNE
jgi:hypothetical protein